MPSTLCPPADSPAVLPCPKPKRRPRSKAHGLRAATSPAKPISATVARREAEASATIAGLRAAGIEARLWVLRLEACRARRERWRRGLRDHKDNPCGLPLCAFCRRTLIHAERRRAAAFIKQYGAMNQTAYWLSVDLARITNLDDVKSLQKGFADNLRKARQRDPRLAGVCALVYAEVVYVPNPEALPPRRRAVVQSLPVVGEAPVWAVHIHALVVQAAPAGQPTPAPIGCVEVRAAVRCLYPDGPEARVYMKSFHAHRTVEANAARLGGYGSKLWTTTTHRGGKRVPWPPERQLEFLVWLTAHRRALQPLRTMVKPEKGWDARAELVSVSPSPFAVAEQAEAPGALPRRRRAGAVRKRNETSKSAPPLTETSKSAPPLTGRAGRSRRRTDAAEVPPPAPDTPTAGSTAAPA